jgi:hypothetical protein
MGLERKSERSEIIEAYLLSSHYFCPHSSRLSKKPKECELDVHRRGKIDAEIITGQKTHLRGLN